MSKPSSPQTPDYVGAANATAASQRVNYQTPWGQINWYAPGQNIPRTGGLYSPSVEQGAQPGQQPTPSTPGRMHALDTGSPGPSGPGDPGSASSDSNMTTGGPFTGSQDQVSGGPTYMQPGVDPRIVGTPTMGPATYNTDPWTQVVSLSPDQQRLYDQQTQTSLGLADLQNQGLEGVRNLFGHMPSQADLPAAAVNPGQTGQDAIMARMQPLLDRQQDRLSQQLANQGIQVGSEAYTNAQGDFGRQANDAYSQAALHGIDLTQQARQQAMGEQGFYSQLPINLLNALRSGSQVQLPTGPTTGPGANYSAAAQAQGNAALGQYGSDVSSYNSNMGALASLLAAYMGSSDRRLKTNIVQIGMHPIGVPRYEYDIRGRRERGVMAQDLQQVMPEAVDTGPDGYLRVHYWMIGGR